MKKLISARKLCLILAIMLIVTYMLVPSTAMASNPYEYENWYTTQPTYEPTPDPDGGIGEGEGTATREPKDEILPPVYMVTDRLEDKSLRSDVVVSLPTIIEDGAMVTEFSPHVLNLINGLIDYSFENRHEVNGIHVRWNETVEAPDPRSCRLTLNVADLDELLERLPKLDMQLDTGFGILALDNDMLHELSELDGEKLSISLTSGDPVSVEYSLDGEAIEIDGGEFAD